MLADRDTWCSGCDWLELTANIFGSIRFWIEAIVLSQATRKEDVNDRFLSRCWQWRSIFSSKSTKPTDVVSAQSKQSNCSSTDGCPACRIRVLKAITGRHRFSLATGF